MKAKLSALLDRARKGEQPDLHALILAAGYQADDLARLTGRALARIWGVSAQAVGLWHSRDGAPRNPDGSYSLSAVIAWREKYLKASNESAGKEASEGRFKAAQAKLKELELKKAVGQLIDRDEVERGRVSRVMAVRSELMKLGKALAGRLAQRSPVEVQTVLEEAAREIIENFAREPRRR
jgi:hypothetical protein